MRRMTWAVLGLAMMGSSIFADGVEPEVVYAPVSKVFVPTGFDDNDSVQLAIYGEFPNGCYRLDKAIVHERANPNDPIMIDVTAYLHTPEPDQVCMQAVIPFLKTADIGVLTQGVHEVIVNAKDENNKSSSKIGSYRTVISVGKSRLQNPDDADYAPVENADVITDKTGVQHLVIKGKYPLMKRGCMRITEIDQLADDVDLVTVLPKMTYFDDARCYNTPNEFKESRQMKQAYKTVGVLHVRRVQGSALFQLVNQ